MVYRWRFGGDSCGYGAPAVGRGKLVQWVKPHTTFDRGHSLSDTKGDPVIVSGSRFFLSPLREFTASFDEMTSIYFFPSKKEFREGNGRNVNVWFQSRSLPARGRVGLDARWFNGSSPTLLPFGGMAFQT